ncbi:ImmA/IrrE family metallo-endopeptidase [Streptomyces sp. MAI_2237]
MAWIAQALSRFTPGRHRRSARRLRRPHTTPGAVRARRGRPACAAPAGSSAACRPGAHAAGRPPAGSAATFEIAGRPHIVTNPLRLDGRQASDIAHELSYLLLQHDLSEVRELNGTPLRTCQPEEEEQATAFGRTLMLPRPCSSARQERA